MSNNSYLLLDEIFKTLKGQSIKESLAYNPQKIDILLRTIVQNSLFIIILLGVVYIIYREKRTWFAKTVILLAFIDLFIFSKGNLITFPFDILSKENQPAQWLKSHIKNNRYLSTNGNLPYTGLGVYWTHLRAREPFSHNQLTDAELTTFNRIKQELKVLPENQGMAYRISDVSGYAAAIPYSYLQFWEKYPESPNAISIDSLIDDKLEFLAVKYLVTGYPEDYITPLNSDKFKLVYELKKIRIYENLENWPRAFLLDSEKPIPVEIKSFEPGKIVLQSDNAKTSNLVLTDTYYPGWVAFLDGKEAQIITFKSTFMSLLVPQGKHEIIFLYRPLTFFLGLLISFSTAIILAKKLLL